MQVAGVTEALPIACVPDAIVAGERAIHAALVSRLFGELAFAKQPVSNGFAFTFPSSAFPEVMTFVGNERKCCPFLSFHIQLPAGAGALTLTMTGPDMTQEFLAAELLEPSSRTMRNLRTGRACCAGECTSTVDEPPVAS